jgi:hypothetical protein
MTINYKELIETKEALAMNEATCQLLLPALHWNYDQITNATSQLCFERKLYTRPQDSNMTRSNNQRTYKRSTSIYCQSFTKNSCTICPVIINEVSSL